ncbi:hypothetical protein PR001_g33501 [Phytophthora rubi]|uniref:Uncharacterized protein n=1 Tax=Phytophthora rubi TaxID=129364 RepID=A0A6A3G5Q6_9STRA|nr:hypothetical protein PR001_g33501 [Phytophthora rubi]
MLPGGGGVEETLRDDIRHRGPDPTGLPCEDCRHQDRVWMLRKSVNTPSPPLTVSFVESCRDRQPPSHKRSCSMDG